MNLQTFKRGGIKKSDVPARSFFSLLFFVFLFFLFFSSLAEAKGDTASLMMITVAKRFVTEEHSVHENRKLWPKAILVPLCKLI